MCPNQNRHLSQCLVTLQSKKSPRDSIFEGQKSRGPHQDARAGANKAAGASGDFEGTAGTNNQNSFNYIEWELTSNWDQPMTLNQSSSQSQNPLLSSH